MGLGKILHEIRVAIVVDRDAPSAADHLDPEGYLFWLLFGVEQELLEKAVGSCDDVFPLNHGENVVHRQLRADVVVAEEQLVEHDVLGLHWIVALLMKVGMVCGTRVW